MAANSELVEKLKRANYHVEPCVGSESTTVVASFPIDFGANVRSLSEVSFWEQISLAAFLQRYWSDNQVSCTVTFDTKTEGPHLKHALDYFQYQLKGISFLPRLEAGAYPQMPYESISAKTYDKMIAEIKTDSILAPALMEASEMTIEKFCDGDRCVA